ncbi:helix-turn-helix domain-containing protein [Streptomyces sp. NPDC059467]|uniref:helix-turn-helix domain-containing protein n=1 Tax=Streptomyces sp. NPDC059467 TaxID=3346844 RepID=UPI00368CF8DB
MVGIGQRQSMEEPDAPPIPEFGFNAPDSPVRGFEVLDLAELRRRVPGAGLRRVHRADFHSLTLITRGTGEHTVDFVGHPCRPGTLLWVRPGQVQSFDPAGRLDGPHVLFTSAFPFRQGGIDQLSAAWSWPSCWQLGTGDRYERFAVVLAELTAEYARPPAQVSPDILRHLLAVLLLQAHRLPQHGETVGDLSAGGEAYARFRVELERSFATVRRAEEYADRLGYTVKSLTRACLAATGHPVKHVIDTRVALEAQRLLAHTDDPVATVARRLGFSEPTNFGKFFLRLTGTTPGAFRRTQQGRL